MRSLRSIASLLVLLVAASVAWAGDSHTSYLGVDVDDVNPQRVQALKLKSESGVEITMVDNDAPAGKAGLKEHDVILQFNGQNVDSVEELRRMIRETPPGRTVALLVSRDGNPQTINVTLAERSKVMAWPSVHVAPVPPVPPVPPVHIEIPNVQVWAPYGSRAGLVVESLTPQLADYFGSKDGTGALVRSVEKGSPAESAGFKAGDVILRIGDTKVSDRGDLWRELRKGGKLPVRILRDKREQTLTLNLPERRQGRAEGMIVIPDIDIDLSEMAALAPEINELAMQKMSIELQKHSAEMRDSLKKAQKELKQELEREKREMKKQQKELQKQQKEMLKQQLDEE